MGTTGTEDLRNCKNTNQLSATAIRHLTRVAFLLMGEWPNNWQKTAVAAAQPKNWSLTRLRTLHYLRAPAQLFQAILDLTEQPEYKAHLPTREELWETLSRIHKGDYEAFLHWFKHKYPSVYVVIV
jgi:hypothetical protein